MEKNEYTKGYTYEQLNDELRLEKEALAKEEETARKTRQAYNEKVAENERKLQERLKQLEEEKKQKAPVEQPTPSPYSKRVATAMGRMFEGGPRTKRTQPEKETPERKKNRRYTPNTEALRAIQESYNAESKARQAEWNKEHARESFAESGRRAARAIGSLFEKAQAKTRALKEAITKGYAEGNARVGKEYAEREVIPEGAYAKPDLGTLEGPSMKERLSKLGKKFIESQSLAAETISAREGMPFGEMKPTPDQAKAPEKAREGILQKIERDLPNVMPEYANLPAAHKKIIVDGLANRMLEEIRQSAKDQYESRLHNKKFLGRTWGNLLSFGVQNTLLKIDQTGRRRWVWQKDEPRYDINHKQIKSDWRDAHFDVNVNPMAFAGKMWNSFLKNGRIAGYEKDAYVAFGGSEPRSLLSRFERFVGMARRSHKPTEAEQAAKRADFIARNAGGMIAVLKDMGSPSYRLAEGEPDVLDFTGTLSYMSAEQLQKYDSSMHAYNLAATAFSKIPYEWGTPDAKKSERKAYEEASAALRSAERTYLAATKNFLREEAVSNPQTDAARFAKDSRARVEALRFLSANPEAAKLLEDIGESSVVVRGVSGTAGERGAYLAAGAASRKASVFFGLTTVATPIISGLIGAWRGRDRSKKELLEQNRRLRAGERIKGATVIGMGDIGRHIDRLRTSLDAVDQAKQTGNEKAYRTALSALKTRADFLNRKLDLGQVNFGLDNTASAETSRFYRQYELMQELYKAESMLEIEYLKTGKQLYDVAPLEQGTMENGRATAHNLRALLSLDTQDEKMKYNQYYPSMHIRGMGLRNQRDVEAARAAKIKWDTWKGALIGAAFGLTGEGIARWWAPKFGWDHHAADTATGPRPYTPYTGHVHTHGPVPALPHGAEHAAQPGVAPSAPLRPLGPVTEHAAPIAPGVPTPAPEAHTATIDDVLKHSVTHADASAKGAEDMLRAIRHAKGFDKLTPEQQAFFKDHTLDEIAKETHLYRPGEAAESALIPKGSSIEVTDDGHMYLVDRAHGNVHEIGVINKDGTFTASENNDLEYMHAGRAPHEAATEHAETQTQSEGETVPEETGQPDQNIVPEETGTYDATEHANHPTPEDMGLRRPTSEELASATAEAPVIPETTVTADDVDFSNPDDVYVSYKSWSEYDPTRYFNTQELARASARATNHMAREINRFFGRHNFLGELTLRGTETPLWHDTMARISGDEFLSLRRVDYPTHHFRPFFKQIEKLAERYPDVRRDQPFPTFMRELYWREAVQHVARKDGVQ